MTVRESLSVQTAAASEYVRLLIICIIFIIFIILITRISLIARHSSIEDWKSMHSNQKKMYWLIVLNVHVFRPRLNTYKSNYGLLDVLLVIPIVWVVMMRRKRRFCHHHHHHQQQQQQQQHCKSQVKTKKDRNRKIKKRPALPWKNN